MNKQLVVVVTGASAGVGRAAVNAFAERKCKIGLIARGSQGLEGAMSELMEFGFLRRYRGKPDEPGEGSFVLCNFRLVQCLAQSNRIEEAEKILEKTTHAANHLGLFSEMFDSRYGVLLGNFPQGYGHIGFINATQVLKEAKQIKN